MDGLTDNGRMRDGDGREMAGRRTETDGKHAEKMWSKDGGMDRGSSG